MDNDRLKHSYSVGFKMAQIAKDRNLSEEEIKTCFVIGFNHDIGYQFTEKGFNHNKIGGEILRRNNFIHWQEVYYHGDINPEYSSLYLDILNQADMMIDKYGNDVGYNLRLEDIKSRYGEESKVYLDCSEMVRQLKEKGFYDEADHKKFN